MQTQKGSLNKQNRKANTTQKQCKHKKGSVNKQNKTTNRATSGEQQRNGRLEAKFRNSEKVDRLSGELNGLVRKIF
jgi:hypothetical protein